MTAWGNSLRQTQARDAAKDNWRRQVARAYRMGHGNLVAAHSQGLKQLTCSTALIAKRADELKTALDNIEQGVKA